MSGRPRDDMVGAAVDAIDAYLAAAAAFDEAAADYLGLTRTELRSLAVIEPAALSASQLADRLHLTRGAITALVDRLEAKGFAERQAVPGDRRRINVVLTENGRRSLAEVYDVMADEGRARMKAYTNDQLHTIAHFLNGGREMQLRMTQRLLDRARTHRSGADD